MQHPKLYEHVFVYFDQYSKVKNEYHQQVQEVHSPSPKCPANSRSTVAGRDSWAINHIGGKGESRSYSSLYTSKINMQNIARINSTVTVIQACLFRAWSVREVTQTSTQTSTTNMYSRSTYLGNLRPTDHRQHAMRGLESRKKSSDMSILNC